MNSPRTKDRGSNRNAFIARIAGEPEFATVYGKGPGGTLLPLARAAAPPQGSSGLQWVFVGKRHFQAASADA